MVFLQSLSDHVLSISSCSLFLMIMMMLNLVFAAGPTGLTMKLIHRDSPGSPLYPGNLTKLERIERAFQRSINREHKLLSTWRMKQQNSNGRSDIDTIHPEVKAYDDYSYMVELGIGTFSNLGGSPSYYDFYFDTASDLLWLQCDSTPTGSRLDPKYFLQNKPIFNLEEVSLTFSPFPYNSSNDICQKYVRSEVPAEGRNFCGYEVKYADGAGTEGVLATEKLTVSSDEGGTEEIKDFVFGCGYRQNEPNFGRNHQGQNPIAGILGLGGGEESFILQLGDRVDNKFEYCLKPWYSDHESHTLLRFGSNTRIVAGGPDVDTTKTFHIGPDTYYYVNMVGISIDKKPVVYPEGSDVFASKTDSTGGCIFDAGHEVTTLSKAVYAPFRNSLIEYFKNYNMTILKTKYRAEEWKSYDLCFRKRRNIIPTITFHFDEGAEFVMDPITLFRGDKRTVCLIILGSRKDNTLSVVLGSMQQTNRRILHDLGMHTISWVRDICDLE